MTIKARDEQIDFIFMLLGKTDGKIPVPPIGTLREKAHNIRPSAQPDDTIRQALDHLMNKVPFETLETLEIGDIAQHVDATLERRRQYGFRQRTSDPHRPDRRMR